MKAISDELRKRIVEAYVQGGASRPGLARHFSVSKSSVRRLLSR